ncbi:TrkA-N domain superfamily [Synechococcus sp. PCC 7335]|uniref:potassium channel family protein n=1 Tax=Synechococcus sp. (strain ATCC 29403 / PCC 7335) TaxID=91464 RepID=UPI00017EB47E|nr:NAD-binding protein [Synechococcus sp. PCC 7335]EDX83979.1 TrkA-N domain superfamily [Synechococcus sp. PCC 7335]
MYLIVVGAGPEGQRFIQIALEQNHEVALIEKEEGRAREILKEHDVRAFVGSIGDEDILNEAEVDRADAVVATTHDDAQNLMAMVLAKEHKVETCISLVNQQSHTGMFERLGVQVISDPAGIVAHRLYEYVDSEKS